MAHTATRSENRQKKQGVRDRLKVDWSTVMSFDDVLQSNIGRFMSPTKFLEGRISQQNLEEQTFDLAYKLEEAGVPCIAQSTLTLITDVTEQRFEIPNFRNINVLPSVAQKNRRSILNDIGFYLENMDRNYWRYAVVTFGDRIPAFGDLRGAITAAKKKLRKWRFLASRDFHVEFGFVGLEFPRDADGTYHLHANILFKTPLFMDKGAAWRAFTHEFFDTWWKDAGQIKNVRELVKYPFKPNDIEGCEGDELRWLAESVYKKRICEVLGNIGTFRRMRAERGERVVSVGGKLRLRKVEKIFPEDDDKERTKSLNKPENIIVARVPPGFIATPWAESATLVYNYRPVPGGDGSVDRLFKIQEFREQAREIWNRKGCPAPETALNFATSIKTAKNVSALWEAKRRRQSGETYMVHNETISVPEEFSDLMSSWEEPVIETIEDPPDKVSPERFLSVLD